MSLSELWPQLTLIGSEPSFDSGPESSHIQYTDNTATWKVLYANRSQPLFVPMDITQARFAISFFIRNPMLRYWGNVLLTLDYWLPRTQLLPVVRLEHFPYHTLFGSDYLNKEARTSNIKNLNGTKIAKQLSLFCGLPGPLQKLTVYSPAPDGRLGKVAKVAMKSSAYDAISHEAHWLKMLGNSPEIAKFLPRILKQGSLSCGRYYLTMQSLPQGASPQAFGEPHFEFLHLLAQQKLSVGPWGRSQAFLRLEERTQATLPLVDDDLQNLWLDVLDEISVQIGKIELPACMIHGDFAPWNLRLIDKDLFVFDWEYAQTNGNPLQDFLHYHLVTKALQRGSLQAEMMDTFMQKAVEYADRQFGNNTISTPQSAVKADANHNVAAACGVLTLHYLLDTMTFYVSISGYMHYKHPVLSAYLKLLKNRSQWLPHTVTPYLKHKHLLPSVG